MLLRKRVSARKRFALSALIGLALSASASAQLQWDSNTGSAGPQDGNGIWNLLSINWWDGASNVPFVNTTTNATFGIAGPVGPAINRVTIGQTGVAANTLSFNQNYVLNGDRLNLATGTNFTVATNALVQVDSVISTATLGMNGGGSLYLGSNVNLITGNTTIDGVGTTLIARLQGAQGQGLNQTDLGSLGLGARTINIQNGGRFRFIGGGYNPASGTKVFALSGGNGVFDVAGGYSTLNLDDAGQITAVAGTTLTKEGFGRLTLAGQDWVLASNLVVNKGVFHNNRLLAGSTTAGTRFSGLSAASTITVNNGGMYLPTNGTAGVVDNAITLNAGGVLGMGGADQEYGVRTGTGTTTVLNGGTLLSREADDPQTTRFMRIQGLLSGSGIVDIVGVTSNAGNSRIVFQRGDLAHTFNGRFVLRDRTVLESSPRSGSPINIGKTFGDAALELQGYNSGLDLRDNGTASNSILTAYGTNDIVVSSAIANARPTISVNVFATGPTGNTFGFDDLSIGEQWLTVSGGNTYGLRFNTVNTTGLLTAVPTFETTTAPLTILGPMTEHAAGGGINKYGAANLELQNVGTFTNTNILGGTLTLAGTSGSLVPGAGASTVRINGATLNLLNTAANNNNRLADTLLPIEMRSNSTLRLSADAAVGTTENVSPVTAAFGNPNFDVTVNSPAAVSSLTFSLTRGVNTGVNFSGTGTGVTLGGGGNNPKIILTGQADSTFLGGWAVSGAEFAKYDATGLNGVQPLAAIDSVNDPLEAAYTTGVNVKTTLNTPTVSLLGSRSINSLNYQLAAAMAATTDTLQIGTGNTLTLESGGLLNNGANAIVIDRFAAAAGSITAGTTLAPAQLFVTNSAGIQNSTTIVNNSAGGVVTLVKNGTGALTLTNLTTANTYTGGTVINNGTLDVWRGNLLGAASNTITLAGGTLNLNVPGPGGASNTNIPDFGQNVVVEGNSLLGSDNNGETGGSGTGNLITMGSLTINGSHILGLGGFDNYDMLFTGGANFVGGPILNFQRGGVNVVQGALTGSGFTTIGTASALQLGNGSTDSAANTYSTPLNLNGGTLRLNKANGTNAIVDLAGDDIVLNGGALAWGPGAVLATTVEGVTITNPGIGSGQNQIPDTASILLLTGTLNNDNNRVVNETIGNLTMRNGALNAGLGTIEFTTATVSGGAIAFNSGSNLKFGTLTMALGAPNLNVLNDSNLFTTTLDIGAGGLSLTGQNITLGTQTSGNRSGAGSVLKLGGNLTVNSDLLNTGSYNRGIFVQTGQNFREIGDSAIDLMGGTRTINIDKEVYFRITAPLTNGGIIKTGGGQLVLDDFALNASDYTGSVTINDGILSVRTGTGLGTAAGGVTVNNGGSLKIEGSNSTYSDNITLSGPGAVVPNADASNSIRELGALFVDFGSARLNGSTTLTGDATIGSNAAAYTANGQAITQSNLAIASPLGITGTGNLVLSGAGRGQITNGVNTTGGISLTQGGNWTLGTSSFTGNTSIESGTLELTGNKTGTGAIAVYGGGQLRLNGNTAVAGAVQLSGNYNSTGALNQISGTGSLSGAVSLGVDATINADGALTLANGVNGTVQTLTWNGEGAGTINGVIALTTGGITKTGSGSLAVNGVSTYSGATNVTGGTLAVGAAGSISSSSSVNLSGWSNLSTAGSQTLTGLGLANGGGRITAAGPLIVNAITRTAGGAVNFSGAGPITTSNVNTNGILGGYATFGGTDFAEITAGTIGALATYTPFSLTGVDTNNSLVTASQIQTGATTTNSLKFTASSPTGLYLGGSALTLTSGGLIFSGTGNSGILGTAGPAITAPTTADDLILHVASGSLDINAPLIGAGTGNLIKNGAGNLQLSATSTFTGNVYINGGTLSVIGGNAGNALGGQPATGKDIVVNGGTLAIINGGFDPGANSEKVVIGGNGGTVMVADGSFQLNDANQFTSSGNLVKTGGGRLIIGGANNYVNAGDIIVNQGVLQVGQNNATTIGGPDQTIIANAGTAFINGSSTQMLNNISINSAAIYAVSGDRTFLGTASFSGNSTIGLIELDTVNQARSITFNGPISGSGTIDVYGAAQGNILQINSAANSFTATTMNLKPNASIQVHAPGALGQNPGDLSVDLGALSRVILRGTSDGDFKFNLISNSYADLNVDRTTNSPSGTSQYLAVNNLTLNADAQLRVVGGANSYSARVAGTGTFNTTAASSPILNVITTGIVFDNGISFAGSNQNLDKRGAGTLQLLGAATNTGNTDINAGVVILRGANGALTNAANIRLRGGELRLDDGDVANTNRISDTASVILAGGTLRVTSEEAVLGALVTATGGTTLVSYHLPALNSTTTLNLPNFTRSVGATVAFLGDGTVGATNTNVATTNSAIQFTGTNPYSGAQPTTQVMGFVAGGGLNDFARYGGTAGIQNLGNGNYTTDAGEGAYGATVITRVNGTDQTLTASRSLLGMKLDGSGARTVNVAGFDLTINSNDSVANTGIIVQSANQIHNINSDAAGTGGVTAGNGSAAAELIVSVNSNVLNFNSLIKNNGANAVSLVKTGTQVMNLSRSVDNTGAASFGPGIVTNPFTGGIYVNQGTLATYRGANLGASTNLITLAGGTLNLNIPQAPLAVAVNNIDLPGLGHSIVVNSNSSLILDNNGELGGTAPAGTTFSTDNNALMGSLTINDGYTLSVAGNDSYDIEFNGGTFTNRPTILMQGGNGSTMVMRGNLTGNNGFILTNNDAATPGVFQLGGTASATVVADNVANTYTGPLIFNGGPTGNANTLNLGKADGITAVTGDLIVNGGTVSLLNGNQIADTSNVTINLGSVNLNAKSETINSLVVNGGTFLTGTPTALGGQLTVLGDVTLRGTNNANRSLQVNTAAGLGYSVVINGALNVWDYGGVIQGSAAPTLLSAGSINMTGTTIRVNETAAISSRLILNGNVTTNPAVISAQIVTTGGTSTTNRFELGADAADVTRTFAIADGGAGIDLLVTGSTYNGAAASTFTAGIIKTGAGTLQLAGTAANAHTGLTTVNEGIVQFNKTAAINAIGGNLVIGDGTGSDIVQILNSNQIPDASSVTMGTSGVLDLEFTNTSETVGDFSGTGGTVLLGPGSTFTTNMTSAGPLTYAGVINGAGAVVKGGTGSLALTGVSSYSGTTTINAGELSIGSIANGGVTSAIGNSSAVPANLVIGSTGVPATLTYTGAAASTDRLFTINTGGATINASGTGAVNFTNTGSVALSGTNTARTISFGGTNTGANTMTPLIANNGTGATSLNKTGTGTWVLAGNNTYTGTTTVTSGTLRVNGTHSGTGAVTVNTTGTLGGSGTLAGATTVDGSVAPGNSIGTLTVTNDVTWNWNPGNAWVWELGAAGPSIASPGTSDLLNLTGNFNKVTGTGFTFDFSSTGSVGTYKLVDWGGTTNFVDTDFVASNLPMGFTSSFVIDAPTSALYLTLSSMGGTTGTTYTLAAAPTTLNILQGGNLAGTVTIANTGSGTVDTLTYSSLTGTSGTPGVATATGSGSGGPLAQGASAVQNLTVNGIANGSATITSTVASATNTVLATPATFSGPAGTINVVVGNASYAGGDSSAALGTALSAATPISMTAYTNLSSNTIGQVATGPGTPPPAIGTTATLLYYTNSTGNDTGVSMAWRSRKTIEASSGVPGDNGSTAVGYLISDVVSLTGMANTTGVNATTPNQTDTFVLQISYNEALLGTDAPSAALHEANGGALGRIFLAWNNNGTWTNAVDGNIGGTENFVFRGYQAGDENALGRWGVDINNNVAWAVLNHNSEFAVIPEPSTLVLGGLALLGFAGVGLRRRRMNVK